jgi:hypothetical protein
LGYGGRLGVPLDILKSFKIKFYEFRDTELSTIAQNVDHAVAINEYRIDYDVRLLESEVET